MKRGQAVVVPEFNARKIFASYLPFAVYAGHCAVHFLEILVYDILKPCQNLKPDSFCHSGEQSVVTCKDPN